MSFLRFVRENVVDRLPRDMRLAIERAYFGIDLAQEKRLFRSYCRSDRTAVDVGANKGDLTLFLSPHSAHVHVFEPVPAMAAALRHRFRGTNVTVHEFALGATRGGGVLRIPIFGSEVYTTRATLLDDFREMAINGKALTEVIEETVQIRPLDDFDTGPVRLIKIDVEGFELDVLKGAERTLRTHRPVLYVEIEQRRHRGQSIEDIFSHIASLGYSGWFHKSNAVRPISEFSVEVMQARGMEDTDSFVNNFLFLPLKPDDR